jgi:predicted RND superfamily exporter protein
MAWAFGYVTLAVGHLNILSVAFTVTLIGIGIDYGTYYVSRYLQARQAGLETREALLDTARSIGPAISTGAITTAVAFFAAGFTEFRGVAELGIIAGGGILLCAVAELFVLPAAILLVDRSRWGRTLPAPLPVHRWLAPFCRWPRWTLAAGLAATLLVGIGSARLRSDHNLMNMQVADAESVAWEQRLLSRGDGTRIAGTPCRFPTRPPSCWNARPGSRRFPRWPAPKRSSR